MFNEDSWKPSNRAAADFHQQWVAE